MSESTKCIRCPLGTAADLQTNCMKSTWSSSEKPLITFVVESPSAGDDKNGSLLNKGSEAEEFWSAIDGIGIPRSRVSVVPLLRCAKGDTKVTPDMVEACLPYLWNELSVNKPELVVAAGLPVAKILTGHAKLSTALGYYGPMATPKKMSDVPEALRELNITASSSPGAIWSQRKLSIGNGDTQFKGAMTQAWHKLNGRVRDERCDYQYLETFEDIDAFFTEIETEYMHGRTPGVIVDIESNMHLNPHLPTAELVAIGFSYKPWQSRAVLIKHKDESLFSVYGQPVWEAFCRRMQELFDRVPAGGWNLKFDIRWIRNHTGVEVRQVFYDGNVAHAAIYSELLPHDLKNAASYHLNTPIPDAQLNAEIHKLRLQYPENPERWHHGWVPKETLLSYLGGDVDKTLQMYYYLLPLLSDDLLHHPEYVRKKLKGFDHRWSYYNVQLPAILTYSRVEDFGIKTNKKMIEYLVKEFPLKIEQDMDNIFQFSWVQNYYNELSKEATDAYDEKIANRKTTRKVTTAPPVLDRYKLITSYQKLSTLLFDEAGFPTQELGLKKKEIKTASGVTTYFPTGAPVRQKLMEYAIRSNQPDLAKFVAAIDTFKKNRTLYTSYIKRMLEFSPDGFIHPTYNLTGTRTGRFSTQSPNLHSIPSGDKTIKKMFESRWQTEGGLILEFDYAQLEMRIAAAVSGDPAMVAIYTSDIDTHRLMAARIFNKKPEDVTTDERKAGKTVAFGVLYGMSAVALAVRIGVSESHAAELIKAFFIQFPKLSEWMSAQKKYMLDRSIRKPNTGQKMFDPETKQVMKDKKGNVRYKNYQMDCHGWVETPMGRKRILPFAAHWETGKASKAERQAGNSPIQGAASDLALEASNRIDRRLQSENCRSQLFGFIHDSLKADVAPGELKKVFAIMREEMEDTPHKLHNWLQGVPIKTSSEIGSGWGYMLDVEAYDLSTDSFTLKGKTDYIKAVQRSLDLNYKAILTDATPIPDKTGKVTEYSAKFVIKDL